MSTEWEMEVAVEELPPLRVKDMISVGNDREELLQFVALDAENARTSSGIIINTADVLERAELEKLRRDLSLPVFAVGPLHKFAGGGGSSQLQEQERMCIEWLDKQPPRSVLYVSFGSLACVDRDSFREMAWGLANSGRSFLWVLRPGSVGGGEQLEAELPEGIRRARSRGSGMTVEWAPQREVLAHGATGGFWTHGGWNSTVEALAEGVPVMCTPLFADQMGNARYAAEVWKVGVEVRAPLERRRVEGAVARLLGREGEEMRERAGRLRRGLSQGVAEGGSSHRALRALLACLSLSATSTHSVEL